MKSQRPSRASCETKGVLVGVHRTVREIQLCGGAAYPFCDPWRWDLGWRAWWSAAVAGLSGIAGLLVLLLAVPALAVVALSVVGSLAALVGEFVNHVVEEGHFVGVGDVVRMFWRRSGVGYAVLEGGSVDETQERMFEDVDGERIDMIVCSLGARRYCRSLAQGVLWGTGSKLVWRC